MEYRPIALMLYKLVNFHGAKVWQYTILGNRLILGKWKGVIPIYNDSHKTTIHAQKKQTTQGITLSGSPLRHAPQIAVGYAKLFQIDRYQHLLLAERNSLCLKLSGLVVVA